MAAPPLTTEPAGPRPAGSVASPARPGPARADRAAPDPSPPGRLLDRARLAVVCLGLVALALSQSPGRVVSDTKLDVWVDPLGFLGRALSMWDPEGFAGQVQNQAYGYLWPMGPFSVLLRGAGLPPWVVQRLWWALLLCTAFLGVVVLARRLRIGSPAAVVLGGLAYALAPRMVTSLGATSIEVLPMAVAPWVLVPLVGAAALRSPRRAAALSGLAVFCAGGVNAVAAAAVLPLPVLWLLTRRPGRARRRLAAWWALAVVLATAWWAGPLLLLGRYSVPFLDLIETAATTTAPTDLLSVLRGTDHWVPALATSAGPLWPAGWSLLHDVVPVTATVVLAAAGLAALCRPRLRERTWLVLGVLAGAALVTMGHLAAVDGVLAGWLREALDGPLAPLRNVHKFDPVLRLPLVLALVDLVAAAAAAAAGPGVVRRPGRPLPGRLARAAAPLRRAAPAGARVGYRATVAVVVLGVAGVALPAVQGRLAPPAGFEAVPGYWQQAADFLARDTPSGRALLVPGSSFATYGWGTPNDEPLQVLAESPWEVRNAVPLAPNAHVRVLDAVEARLAAGQGSEALTRYLARAGISHVVVRNDLDVGASGSPRPVLVHQALRDSPGIRRVAAFGPDFPGAALLGRVFDAGLAQPLPAVEVFGVADPAPRAWTAPLADAVTVSGGPDGVLALEDQGLVTGRPTVLAGAGVEGTGAVAVSDALVRRERSMGRLTDAASQGLAPEDPLRLDAPARDHLLDDQAAAESVVRYTGAVPGAAASASDADSYGGADPARSPWAAVDGDPTTAWYPPDDVGTPAPVEWTLRTDEPVGALAVSVTLPPDVAADPPSVLLVGTDTGSLRVRPAASAAPQQVPLPPGATRSIRLSVPAGETLGLAEVAVPGLTVTRSVVLPDPGVPADAWVLAAAGAPVAGCATSTDADLRCGAPLVDAAEEPAGLDRVLTVADTGGGAASYDLALTAVPRAGPALDELLASSSGTFSRVAASSTAVPDPRAGAAAVADGDPETAWHAAADDGSPTLVVSWLTPQTVDRLRVETAGSVTGARPGAVTLSGGGITRTLRLDDDGAVSFTPVTTDRLTITFELAGRTESFDPYTRTTSDLGVVVGELEVTALAVPDPGRVVEVPCGEGPVVALDGQRFETSVRTTLGALRDLTPLPLELCDPAGETLRLAAGEHRFTAAGTPELAVRSATLLRTGGALAATPGTDVDRAAADVVRWGTEHREVRVAARDEPALLVVPENANPGWTATLDGAALQGVAVDGWQQGWVLPAGAAGTVRLDYGPGGTYRAALAGGAAAVALLVALAAWRPATAPGPPARPSARPARGRRFLTAVVVLAALAGTALAGGAVGLAVLAVAAVLGVAAGRRRFAVLAVLAASLVAAAGVLLAVDGAADARQALGVAALSVAVASVLPLPSVLPLRRRRGSATPSAT
ncbi:alpha-(1-_3)-arabinofuranosyltransferase family protein [Geodermatophilus sp. SYSU D01106]